MRDSENKVISRKTALAVDDDMVILSLVRKVLEKEYDVCLAKTADSAYSILENTFVDILLLDIEMPYVSGLDLIKRLRKNPYHYFHDIPAIFITSHGTKDLLLQASRAGADDFIVKPMDSKVLLRKIGLLINSGSTDIHSREYTLKLLHMMAVACKTGNNPLVEKISELLKPIKYNYGTDSQIIDICQKALNFDYLAAINLIDGLYNKKLFDHAKENEQENR